MRVVRLAVGEGAARTGRLTLLLLSVLAREQLPQVCGPGCSDRVAPPAHELSCGGRVFREDEHQPAGTGESPWHGRLVAQHEASRVFGGSFDLLWALAAPAGADPGGRSFVAVLPDELGVDELSACSLRRLPGLPTNQSTAAPREPPPLEAPAPEELVAAAAARIPLRAASYRLQEQELAPIMRRFASASGHAVASIPPLPDDDGGDGDVAAGVAASPAVPSRRPDNAAQRISSRLRRREARFGDDARAGGATPFAAAGGGLSFLQLGSGATRGDVGQLGSTDIGEASELETRNCMAVGAAQRISTGVQAKMKTKFIIGAPRATLHGPWTPRPSRLCPCPSRCARQARSLSLPVAHAGVISTIALPLVLAILMPLVMIIVVPLLAPIIKMAVDLFEAILNPLLEAAMCAAPRSTPHAPRSTPCGGARCGACPVPPLLTRRSMPTPRQGQRREPGHLQRLVLWAVQGRAVAVPVRQDARARAGGRQPRAAQEFDAWVEAERRRLLAAECALLRPLRHDARAGASAPPPYPHPFFADTCLCPCPPASAT